MTQKRESIPMSRAKFATMWARGMSLNDMADLFGCTPRTITKRVRDYDLPTRTGGAKRKVDWDTVRAMYVYGIEIKRIAASLGIHWQTVNRIVTKLGLDARGKGFMVKQRRPDVEDFYASLLVAKMRATAANEQRQIIFAEMADVVDSNRVGLAKARAA